jgi:hypothetical protein
MGQGTRDLRREVEDARGRLAEDMQALANQMNVPRRVKRKVDDSVVSARRRISLDREASRARQAMWDIRHGRRAEGLRKLGPVIVVPATIAVTVGSAAVMVTRRRGDDEGHGRSHRGGGAQVRQRAGFVASTAFKSGMIAASHRRHARKSGRAPKPYHLAAYAAVGLGMGAATKWLNARIDRSAPRL